jgi:DNA-binding SARP family transcriptional activator
VGILKKYRYNIRDKPRLKLSVEVPFNWQDTFNFFEKGEYYKVSKVLLAAKAANEKIGERVSREAIAAALEISMACSLCMEEAAWYRKGYDETSRREGELKKQLLTLLKIIYSNGSSEKHNIGNELPKASQTENGLIEFPKKIKIWQQYERMPGWSNNTQRQQQASDNISIEEERITPYEDIETQPITSFEENEDSNPIWLTVYCLGEFRVYQDDKLLSDWPSGRGKGIFKYMIAHHGRHIAKDILMDIFWRNSSPESARNNLNVAVFGLRKALKADRPDFNHIIFKDEHYMFNPAMKIWVDSEEFMQHYETGHIFQRKGALSEAIKEYEIAEDLYQGEFLEEDLYEDWPMLHRDALRESYINILDELIRYYFNEKKYPVCIRICQKLLMKDNWREDCHRRLMRCYYRLGQRNLALRQYDLCVQALERELEVRPSHETLTLYQKIRNGEAV